MKLSKIVFYFEHCSSHLQVKSLSSNKKCSFIKIISLTIKVRISKNWKVFENLYSLLRGCTWYKILISDWLPKTIKFCQRKSYKLSLFHLLFYLLREERNSENLVFREDMLKTITNGMIDEWYSTDLNYKNGNKKVTTKITFLPLLRQMRGINSINIWDKFCKFKTKF